MKNENSELKALEKNGWKVTSCISYCEEHNYKAVKGRIVYWGKSISDLYDKIFY